MEPQRANAAQLAARNIKAAKNRRRPIQSSGTTPQQSMSFGGDSTGGGGMFGGNFQNSGTFNFAAQGGPAFPSASFAATNSTANPFAANGVSVTGEPKDPNYREDTTGEEALRRKRPFQQDMPQQSANLFGSPQLTNTLGQASSPSTPINNTFGNGISQPAASSIFGTNPVQDKPAANPFTFGGTNPATPSINFGSAPSDAKPTGSVFGNFGQTATQPAAPTSPLFSFGNPAPQQSPAKPSFSFGASSNVAEQQQTPAQSSLSFGASGTASPTQQTPAQPSFSFGASGTTSAPQQSSAKPSFTFGASSTTPAPQQTSFSFGAKNNATEQQTPAQPSFGGSSNVAAAQQTPAKPSFSFGANSTTPGPSTGTFSFGASNPTSAPLQSSTSSLFGAQTATPTVPSNSLGSVSSAHASPGSFTSPKVQSSTQSTNIFGSAGQSSTPGIFDKTTSTSTAVNGTGHHSQNGTSTASALFGAQDQNSNNAFGATQQTPKPLSAEVKSAGTPNLFGSLNNSSGTAQGPANLSKPAETSTVFGNTSKPSETPNKLFGTSNSTTTSTLFGSTEASKSSNLFGNLNKPVNLEVSQPKNATGEAQALTLTSTTAKAAPPAQPAKVSFVAGDSTSPSQSPSKPTDASSDTGPFNNKSAISASPSAKIGPSAAFVEKHAAQKVGMNQALADMAASFEISDDIITPSMPGNLTSSQKTQYSAAYRMRALNSAIQMYFNKMAVGEDITPALQLYSRQRDLIMNAVPRSPTKLKPSANNDVLGQSHSKRDISSNKSDLDLQGNQLTNGASPSKSASPNKQATAGALAPPNAQSLFMPKPAIPSQDPDKASTPSVPLGSTPTGKRKADVQITKDDQAKRFQGDTGGSQTSALFKNILESPPKTTPKKTVKSLPEAVKPTTPKDDAPRFNPFGALPGVSPLAAAPASPLFASPAPQSKPASGPPSNTLFSLKSPEKGLNKTGTSSSEKASAKPTSGGNTSNIFATQSSNPFSPKIPGSQASDARSVSSQTSAIKPPNFGGGPVNFLAQFNQQASKSAEEAEKKRMEDAKAEDFESDDETEVEWELRYKEKRKKELKEIEDVAKNARSSFVAGQGFSFKPVNATPSTSSNVFGGMVEKSASNIFGSSTSATAMPSSSVLDKSAPSTSAVSNPFAHLANKSTGQDEEDADSANDSEEDDGGDEADHDLENKDPKISDLCGSATKNGTLTSSSKGLFDSSTATSKLGSSTPGSSRSLFDRISKPIENSPFQPAPVEEKENEQPQTSVNIFTDTSNPFAKSFTKTNENDKKQTTWNPDSPIRFASATPKANVSNPTVNVTEATPTKAATPFAGLFGSNSTAKPLPSSPGVGFSFGATPSTPSSLFPSAVASATPSRATTPGGTTDGESANDDPDAEKHEQINLTAGGPGEEDEIVVHEVRAKALQFNEKREWASRGVGILRVLKHKEKGNARILLRSDPAGTILMNKSILDQNFKPDAKTMKVVALGTNGELETWLLQVKTPEMIQKLAKVLTENKPSAK